MEKDMHENECGCGCGHEHGAEDEALYITLEFEDGTEVECEVLDTITLDGKNYMALQPENQEEYYVYGYNENDEGVEIINIDDEDEFNKVVNEFQARFDALDEMEEDVEEEEEEKEEVKK